jgi:NAD(P) transhydrogenase subunit alpha
MTGFVGVLTVFVLAIFIGFEVITKVPPTLHTPLMSGSNAISGITIIGSLILAGQPDVPELVHVLAGIAVGFAMINVVGGFLVTHRMRGMFQKTKG